MELAAYVCALREEKGSAAKPVYVASLVPFPRTKARVSMASAAAAVRVWFRLEGAVSADFVDMPSNANVAELRRQIKMELANELRHVDAFRVSLSTADGATYNDPRASVSIIPQDAELLVQGAV